MSFMDDPVEYSTVGRTKQSMREECDINKIVAKARQGGAVTHLARGVPSYADFSDVGDYKTAVDRLRAADEFFAELPSKVREAFRNDAGEFLEGMDTPEGRAVLEAAGLIPPIPVAVPVPAPVVAPPPSGGGEHVHT